MINIIQNTIGALGRRVASTPSFVGLLNTYSGAAIAYSLRQLDSTYAGSAIRVRRSSDNTEQDIGFANNVIDTVSLLTFVGSGDGFVDTWYDQSGNANNMTQATASKQLRIVLSGVVSLLNGNPVMESVNNTNYLSTSNYIPSGSQQVVGVLSAPSYFGAKNIMIGSTSGGHYTYAAEVGSTATGISVGVTFSTETVNDSAFTYTDRNDVHTQLATQSILSSNAVFSYATSILGLGYKSGDGGFGAYNLQEFIIFDNQTDQSAKVTAINNHYSVY